MEEALLDILGRIRQEGPLGERDMDALLRKHGRGLRHDEVHPSKTRLLDFYRTTKQDDPARWESWGVTPELEGQLLQTLRLKPRRTASGVATVTVLTKPWPCGGRCLFCPNDLRMPKSYLASEPACQRAEQVYFDPYLQVTVRLEALHNMGHVTDKVELIVLGGTWSDYPAEYQTWFVSELFRALNEFDTAASEKGRREREALYDEAGISADAQTIAAHVASLQARVTSGELSYNEGVKTVYGADDGWQYVSSVQVADEKDLLAQQSANEEATHRCVGLVFETRPDRVSAGELIRMRQLGATKVQLGIQSLDAQTLDASTRGATPTDAEHALALLRLFGFKSHVHLMLNLPGRTPEDDAAEYRRLVEGPALMPDEVKLYPLALVEGTGVMELYHEGTWHPYTIDELVDVLAADVIATPARVRISRMIRDIPSHEIVAGNRQLNLRQLVDERVRDAGMPVHEIRSREIAMRDTADTRLTLEDVLYHTTVSDEHFLQWVTPDGGIAGFCRLSLPYPGLVSDDLPVRPGEAMIREVHVYGRVAGLGTTGTGVQHTGLGRQLVERACHIAADAGYDAVNVISAVGTRGYYRTLGFEDAGLYQRRVL